MCVCYMVSSQHPSVPRAKVEPLHWVTELAKGGVSRHTAHMSRQTPTRGSGTPLYRTHRCMSLTPQHRSVQQQQCSEQNRARHGRMWVHLATQHTYPDERQCATSASSPSCPSMRVSDMVSSSVPHTAAARLRHFRAQHGRMGVDFATQHTFPDDCQRATPANHCIMAVDACDCTIVLASFSPLRRT